MNLVLYKVKVRCIYNDNGTLGSHYMKLLVHASSPSAALKLGDKIAEEHSPIGKPWVQFCALEAAAVTLPILVEDLL